MNALSLIKKTISVGAILCFVVFPGIVIAQADTSVPIKYVPLAPLPGTGSSNAPGATVELATYLPGIFRLSIAAAGALAVIMIVIGGVQYISTDAISGKSEGKERIQNALVGLLLAIASYAILYTINPNTVKFNLSIKRPTESTASPQTSSPAASPNPGGNGAGICFAPGGAKPCTCPTCTVVGPAASNSAHKNLPLKAGAGNQLDGALADMLVQLDEDLKAIGIVWQITEAWRPTVIHQNDCHRNGTCLDANIRSVVDAQSIKTFITIAKAVGLRPEYEVKTQAEYNALKNAGVPVANLRPVSAITAPHFSIYKQ